MKDRNSLNSTGGGAESAALPSHGPRRYPKNRVRNTTQAIRNVSFTAR